MKVCWGVGRGNCGHVYMRRPPYVIPEEATYLSSGHEENSCQSSGCGKALKQISGI